MTSACSGGNPWLPDEGGGDTGIIIPESLAGDLDSLSYDPVAKTLTVRGVSLDDTPYEAVYRRRPNLDVPGYEAYTSQESSLGRHYTSYVQERDGTSAGIVQAGGQFGSVFGGGYYARDGAYTPPSTATANGSVSYAGSYVGLLNIAGDGGDLLPVAPGTPEDVRPHQAAEVTGNVLINADFVDSVVNGVIYARVAVDSGVALDNLDLDPTAIATDGTFFGSVVQGNSDRGDYGGIFGGEDASAVAGVLYVEDHIDGVTNEHEYGLFVLAQCGTANADPLCNQPNP